MPQQGLVSPIARKLVLASVLLAPACARETPTQAPGPARAEGGHAGGGGTTGRGGAPGGAGGDVGAMGGGAGGAGGAGSGGRDAAAPDAARESGPGGAGDAVLPDVAAGDDMRPTRGACTSDGDCTALVGQLDGFLVDESCKGPRGGADCPGQWCDKSNALETSFKLSGGAADPAQIFEVTLQVRGVSECKVYEGGKRRVLSQQERNAEGDAWYAGGVPQGLPDTPWNIHGIHVSPKIVGEANDYYLNACGAGQSETHLTWKLNYQAKIKVRGGGTISYRMADSNCRMIVNCGSEDADMTATCSQAHVVPLTGAVPGPPAGFKQPLTNAEGAKGQFLFLDVLDVKAVE